jgi:hypothetical protein
MVFHSAGSVGHLVPSLFFAPASTPNLHAAAGSVALIIGSGLQLPEERER